MGGGAKMPLGLIADAVARRSSFVICSENIRRNLDRASDGCCRCGEKGTYTNPLAMQRGRQIGENFQRKSFELRRSSLYDANVLCSGL